MDSDMQDYSSFDNEVGSSFQNATEGEYSVKNQGERFAIRRPAGGVGAVGGKPAPTAQEVEEEELQKALEQIRDMEEKDLMQEEGTAPAKINDLLKQGEYVYELFSILIHTGGAFGGHYFAYIKSFEDDKWYNFNDAHVSEITNHEEIFNTFGGSGNA